MKSGNLWGLIRSRAMIQRTETVGMSMFGPAVSCITLIARLIALFWKTVRFPVLILQHTCLQNAWHGFPTHNILFIPQLMDKTWSGALATDSFTHHFEIITLDQQQNFRVVDVWGYKMSWKFFSNVEVPFVRDKRGRFKHFVSIKHEENSHRAASCLWILAVYHTVLEWERFPKSLWTIRFTLENITENLELFLVGHNWGIISFGWSLLNDSRRFLRTMVVQIALKFFSSFLIKTIDGF